MPVSDGMEEGTPRSQEHLASPCLTLGLIAQLAQSSVQTGPRKLLPSKCLGLLLLPVLLWKKIFPWGSATAGARGINSINTCQVPAWCPAALEGTLECRVQVGEVREVLWAQWIPRSHLG